MNANKLPNFWQPDDPRIDGLLDLAHAILDAFELALDGGYGNPNSEVMQEHQKDPEIWPIWTP